MDFDFYLIFKSTGILSFIVFGTYACHRAGLPSKKILPLTILAVIAGYFGSTFWYILQHLYGKEPYERGDFTAMMDGAGSVLYGWILAGTVSVYFFSKTVKLPALKVFDILAPWLLLAQVFNRFGCFAGQCCYGSPTTVAWAVKNSLVNQWVHPVQLYEAFFDFILLIVIWRINKVGSGRRTLVYFMGYPAGRFFLEFFRGDNKPAALGLTVPQLTSVVIFVFTVLFSWNVFRAKRKYT